jgi:purine nucleosidase
MRRMNAGCGDSFLRISRALRWLALAALLSGAVVARQGSVGAQAGGAREPLARRHDMRVILDTDIGDDIDDAYALSLLLSSPGVKLEGVCTVHAAVEQRARLARKLLTLAGAKDVPVIIGLPGTGDADAMPNQAPWAADTDVSACGKDPVAFTAERAAAAPGQIHLLAIGPLTNLGGLFRKHPEAAKQLASVTVMGGSIHSGYGRRDAPEAEYNIRCDPQAARAVVESGANLTLVPLDVTMSTRLTDGHLDRISRSRAPLARAMAALLPLWRGGSSSNPVLHDPLAAALLMDPGLGKTTEMRVEVTDDGMTRPVEGGRPNAKVCLDVDAGRFFDFFLSRLTGSGGS